MPRWGLVVHSTMWQLSWKETSCRYNLSINPSIILIHSSSNYLLFIHQSIIPSFHSFIHSILLSILTQKLTWCASMRSCSAFNHVTALLKGSELQTSIIHSSIHPSIHPFIHSFIHSILLSILTQKLTWCASMRSCSAFNHVTALLKGSELQISFIHSFIQSFCQS